METHGSALFDEGSDEIVRYELSEEQKSSLSLTARIALAISSEAIQKPFTAPDLLTTALMEETELDHETLVEGNKELRREEHIHMEVSADKPGELRLQLTPKGRHFLEDQIKKVTGSDPS